MKILQYKEKITLKNKILIIVGVLLVIIMATIFAVYMLNGNARAWINKYILRKEITDEEVATIELDTDKAQYIYAYDKYIVILCNGKLEIYNNYGVKNQELELGISNPIFDKNGINLIVAENGGQKVCMVSEGKVQWENKIEGNIKKLNIGKDGSVSIITEGTGYKSVIITFDKKGKELFKTYLASTIAVATDISVDGKYLAIAEVNIGGALVESSVRIIEIDKASKGDTTNALIYRYNADSNRIITDIKYQEKGQLVCMYDDSIHIIHNDKENTYLTFNKEVQISDINLKSYIVRAEEISTGLFSSKTDVILTNILTNAETTYTIDSVVKTLKSSEQTVAINLGTEVHFVNLNGWLQKKYISNQEINDIVIGSSVAGMIYRDKVKIITF